MFKLFKGNEEWQEIHLTKISLAFSSSNRYWDQGRELKQIIQTQMLIIFSQGLRTPVDKFQKALLEEMEWAIIINKAVVETLQLMKNWISFGIGFKSITTLR